MRNRPVRPGIPGLLSGIAGAFAIAMVSSVPARAESGVIYACLTLTGAFQHLPNVRIVPANVPCRRNEIRVQWNVVGPQGPTGPQGPQGEQGPTGSQGPQGIQGPPGDTGATGPQGPAGQDGRDGQDGQDGTNAPAGAITGQLTSCVPNTNFAGHLVHIPGRAFSVFTGANGSFQIDNVPAGTYTLSIENAGMALATMTDVTVGSDSIALGDLLLSNTQSDNNNCGACGNVCVSGNICVDGACEAATCAPYARDAAGSCLTSCQNDAQCIGNTYCGRDGTCSPRRPNGSACLPLATPASSECQSGFCVDGLCSDSACTGLCMSTLAALTPHANGVCGFIELGFDPSNECPGASVCDGAGGCTP